MTTSTPTPSRDWPEHLLAEELSRTLHLVREEPDVVVVDDLDHMDGASITVLSFVFGRLRGTGLSVVAGADKAAALGLALAGASYQSVPVPREGRPTVHAAR